MTALLRVELTRLRWRRAVLLLLVTAFVIPIVILAARIWDTRPVSQDDIDAALSQGASEITGCVDHPNRYGVRRGGGEDALQARCEKQITSWYLYRQDLSLAEERGGSGLGVVAVLTAVLLLMGTTFVGHDWASGSMSNQLLFEPRRARVWAAKGTVVTAVAFVVAAVVSSGFWLALWAVMRSRDLPIADDALSTSLLYGVRGAAFAAAAALGGFALTALFRSTVATIGVLFVVSLAGGIFLALLGVGDQWQPTKNVSAIVKNGTSYYVEVPERCFRGMQIEEAEEGSECDQTREISLGHGVGYYGAALLVTAGASVASFRRRDVP